MALSQQDLAAYLESASSKNQISRRPAGAGVPLSFGQEQLWLHSLVAPELPLYNETVTIRYKANLSVEALEQSLNEIVRSHEVYRTSVILDDGIPLQKINAWEPVPFRHVDVRGLAPDQREHEAFRLATESARGLFDFSKSPLLRALVVTVADDDHRLFLALHHLVFDGVAIRNSLLPELIHLYSGFSRGLPASLPEPELQYGDYAYWQRNQLPATRSSAAAYWKSQLADLPVLRLPIARPRTTETGFPGAALRFELNQSLVRAVKIRCMREQGTFFNVLLASFLMLLSRYSGQQDFAVGTVSAGRSHPEFEEMPGYFLNTIVLRTDLSGRPGFQELLTRVQQVTISALSHAEAPFQEIVRAARPTRDKPNPLVQVMFSMEPPPGQVDFPWELVEFDVENGAARIDLHVEVDERPDQLTGRILYNKGLFDLSTVERVFDDWKTLLQAIADDTEESLWDLPLSAMVDQGQSAEGRGLAGVSESLTPQYAAQSAGAHVNGRPAHIEETLNDTENVLEAMWCELLDVEQVGRNENFFDLGGHSLLGARFLARVRQKFSQRLSFLSLIEAPTIAQFAAVLNGGLKPQARTVEIDSSRKTDLLWIGTNSWMHRVAGYLGEDHPVHTLTMNQSELGSLDPVYKMEDLARVMLGLIRERQPEGPYLLGGYCMSALLAYECAQQLRQAGSEVAILILADAIPPGPITRDSWADGFNQAVGRVKFHLSSMADLSPSLWGSYMQGRLEVFKILRTLRELQNPARRKNNTTQLAQHLLYALCAAHSNYDPEPYAGKVLFLQSGKPERKASLAMPKVWDRLLVDREVYHGPQGHIRLFDPPYLRLAAERIRIALEKAINQVSDLTLSMR
jgi:thioesterase domain-containing protein/aryl carrier-like protein